MAERLRQAAAEGRLLAEEFEQRLTMALRARTYGELDPLVADLPRGGAPATRPRPLAPVRVAATAVAVSIAAVAVLAVAAMVITGFVMAWAVWMFLAWWFFSRGRYAGRRRHGYRGGGPWAHHHRGHVRRTLL